MPPLRNSFGVVACVLPCEIFASASIQTTVPPLFGSVWAWRIEASGMSM
jgi:hypothetical protein